jgi:hypothetical protein
MTIARILALILALAAPLALAGCGDDDVEIENGEVEDD